jgi:ferredoxin
MRKRAPRAFVRPPGATADFESRCIGCFRCAEVCPPKCIEMRPFSWNGSAFPHLETQARACTLCMRCTEVCPTGALRPLSPDREAVHAAVRMGTPALTRNRCMTLTRTGNCRLCFEVCPYPGQAITLTGVGQGPVFHAAQCVGCGLCAEACPDDHKAITIHGGVRA